MARMKKFHFQDSSLELPCMRVEETKAAANKKGARIQFIRDAWRVAIWVWVDRTKVKKIDGFDKGISYDTMN